MQMFPERFHGPGHPACCFFMRMRQMLPGGNCARRKCAPRRTHFFKDYSCGQISVEDSLLQPVSFSAFRHQGDDRLLVPQDNGKLAVFAVGAEAVFRTAPEQIAVAVGIPVIFHLFSGTFPDPVRGQQLPAVPAAVLQPEHAQLVKFGNRQEQAAGAEDHALGVYFPDGSADAQRFEKTGRQIVQQMAAGPPLHQDAGQIGAHVVVDKAGARFVGKGNGKGGLDPVRLGHAGTLRSHEKTFFLAQAHGQQIPDRRFLQIFIRDVPECLREGVHQLFIQGNQPLLNREPYGAGGKALAGGVQISPAVFVPVMLVNCVRPHGDFHAQNPQFLRLVFKVLQIHTIVPPIVSFSPNLSFWLHYTKKKMKKSNIFKNFIDNLEEPVV